MNNAEKKYKSGVTKWLAEGYTGKGITIATLDDGQIPYDMNNVTLPYNNHKRGYHKGLVIQALKEITPDANIIGLNFFSDPDQAMRYVYDHRNEIDLVNCSFGLDLLSGYPLLEQCDLPIICATGNDSEEYIKMPASLPYTIAVGAIEESTEMKSYSNYGNEVDCVQFTDIDIVIGDRITKFGGTSASTPFVTGMLALYMQKCKEHSHKPNREQIRQFIKENSVDYGEEGKDQFYGYGLFVLPDPNVLVFLKDIHGHWAEENIKRVAREKLIKGYPDGTFKPDQQVTRAELATVLCDLLDREK